MARGARYGGVAENRAQPLGTGQRTDEHFAAGIIMHFALAAGLAVPDSQLAAIGAKAAGDGQVKPRRPRVILQGLESCRGLRLQPVTRGQRHQVGFLATGQLPWVKLWRQYRFLRGGCG